MARLDIGESFGTMVSLSYNNDIIATKSDEEYRLIPWEQPILGYDIVKTLIDENDLIILRNHFNAVRGREQSFRFKDYTDYRTNSINSALGEITYGSFTPAPDGVTTQHQIMKIYYLAGETHYRPIFKIDERFDVEVYIDGVLNTNYTLDYDTGIITFNSPLSAGVTTWSVNCEFEVYVNFTTDELVYRRLAGENVTLWGVDSLKMIEKRLTSTIPIPTSTFNKKITHELQLSLELDQSGGETFVTKVENHSSGYFTTKRTRDLPLQKRKSGERLLTPAETNYLITLFRVCRGSGSTFDLSPTETDYRFGNEMNLQIASYSEASECNTAISLKSIDLIEAYTSDNSIEILGVTPVVTTTTTYQAGDFYWGFSSANGAITHRVVINNPTLNGRGMNNFGYNLQGDADWSGGNSYTLNNSNNENVRSSVWSSTPLSAVDLEGFEVYVNFSSVGDAGDGFAFSLHGGSNTFLQSSDEGGGLGYLGLSPAIHVEVDGYRNSWDPNNAHVGIGVNGNVASQATADLPSSVISGTEGDATAYQGHMWLNYDGTTMSVYFNSSNTKPTNPTLSAQVKLDNFFYSTTTTTTEYVDGDLTEVGLDSFTLCYCWKIERKDGVIIALTNHDKILNIDGIDYYPNEAPEPSSFSFSTVANVDNGKFNSVLNSTNIKEEDINGGKFDYADITIFLYDYVNLVTEKILIYGFLGEIELTNRIYSTEVRTNKALLQKKSTRVTTRTCPLIFGETGTNRCNKDLTGLQDTTSILTVTGQQGFTVSTGRPDGFYSNGVAEFTSGLNAGIKIDIATYGSNTINLWESAPYEIQAGDTVILTAGCDRTVDACESFGNIENFGGDPYLPGNDFYLAGILNNR